MIKLHLPASWELDFCRELLVEGMMTVERAILLVVWSLTVLTVLLAVYHNINWLWVTGLLGLHLVQASFTGICPVVMTLKKMGLPTKEGFAR